jgi:hypothetical protein
MKFQDLTDKLAVAQSMVVLSQSTLTPRMGDFLATFYDGQALSITDAAIVADGAGGQALCITGRSSFLNLPDLPVSARFSVDEAGEVHAVLRYRLRDAAPAPNAWIFSHSFPRLPVVVDFDTEVPLDLPPAKFDLYAGQRPFLDALDLFDTCFVVSTHAGRDLELDVPLEAGINFVSKMRPQGLFGVLEHVLEGTKILALYGVIRVPRPTDRTLPLEAQQHPWDRSDIPGIHLQAVLGKDVKLGGLALSRARFHVYSPLSREWMAANDSLRPMHGYTCTLAVPSADIEVELGADLQWNLPEALLYGECKGISVGKLAHLADIAGTGGLGAHLPDELQKAVDTLEKLALLHVAVDLRLASTGLVVASVNFTIGIPDLKWKVWGDHLEVDELACRFAIDDPFQFVSTLGASTGTAPAAPAVSVTVLGTIAIEGVPLDIQASSDRGFAIRAATRGKVSIPLDRLLAKHASSITAPSALTVNHIGVRVAPGRSYAMSAVLASAPTPWVLPVGREHLTVSDVVMSFQYVTGSPLAGSFAGKIAFSDDILLHASCDVPGNFMVRSTFPHVNLLKLIERLCDHRLPLPKGFDLTLENASVLIQKRGESLTFQVGASVAKLGAFAFEARSVGGGWGFAAGMDLGGSGLSHLPGLSGLRALEDEFKLQKLMLVVSSFEDAGFQFPDMAQLNQAQSPLPVRSGGVIAGLMVFAEWKISEGGRHQALVMKLLGLGGTESATIAVGENPMADTRLFITRRGKLHGRPFEYKLGAAFMGGVPGLFLTGSLTLEVMGQPQTFDMTGAFVPGGLFLSADMKSGTSIDCKLFKLGNVALQIGVDWAGIPSLGVAATIDVKSFESSVAVMFDSTNPAQSLVAGSVSDLTLKDVADTLLGSAVSSSIDAVLETVSIKGTHRFSIPSSLASDLDHLNLDKVSAAFASAGKVTIPSSSQQVFLVVNKPGESWHLTDLTVMRHYRLVKRGGAIEASIEAQFYFAPQATAIGTIRYPQGYYVNGALDIAGYKAVATVEISQRKGISVEAQMDKLVIGNESLFCIAAARGEGGPKVSVSTFMQPDHPVPDFRLPHFYVNGSLAFLGIREEIFASLTIKGLELDLKGTFAPGLKLEVHVRCGGKGLDASGKLVVGIGTIDLGALGKIHVDTDLEGSLAIVADEKQFAISVEASFKLLDQDHHIAKFAVEAAPDALLTLAEKMEKKVEEEARTVFKDAGRWANAVKDGAVEGVEDTEKVLKNVYGKSEKEAKEMANDIKKNMKNVNKAIETGAKQTEKTVEHAATDVAKDVGKGAKKAFKKLF